MTTLRLPPRYTLIEKEITGSTNTDALALAKDGARNFTLVWAKEQSAARGRFDRKWISNLGNLYWSVIVRPQSLRSESLVFVAALAIRDAVQPYLPIGCRLEIKWPNDNLIDDAKFSGTLIERRGNDTVVGIGINVLLEPPTSQILYPATSLKARGASIRSVGVILERLCETFAHWYDVWDCEGFGATMRDSYLSSMWRLGSPLRVSLNPAKTEFVEGINEGVTEEGYLMLSQGNGQRSIIRTGDVIF